MSGNRTEYKRGKNKIIGIKNGSTKNVQRLKNCITHTEDIHFKKYKRHVLLTSCTKSKEGTINGKRKGTTEMKRKQLEAFS